MEQIRERGPIRFDEFMNDCLYSPGYGYYTSGRLRAGPARDFATSPTLSDIFGKLIARQLHEMWVLCGRNDFTVVEYGAGDGSLCGHILGYTQSKYPDFYDCLHYCIIEKNGSLAEHEKVRCLNSIREIGRFTGCVLTNEVLDNFPVRVARVKGAITEMFVSEENGTLVEHWQESDGNAGDYLEANRINVPAGTQIEYCPAMQNWLSEVESRLQKGFILTVDYGFASPAELNSRKNGSLRSYRAQRLCDSVFSDPGTQDITTHIHFFALRNCGKELGLFDHGICTQSLFMRGAGLGAVLSECSATINTTAALKMLHTLMLGIGNRFFVQVLAKGIGREVRLSGMQFC